MNDYVLMYQVVPHVNTTVLHITTGNIVAFYSIFWSIFFQNDSAWQSITPSLLKRMRKTSELKKKKQKLFDNTIQLFNKHTGF